jgi:pyridoxal phosphate enzyme (YggS family)
MSIASQLKYLRSEMALACSRYGRQINDLQLLVVSKQRAIWEIEEAIAAGECAFGENYVQEAIPKIRALARYPLEWHFLGQIQANKTKVIAEHFAWVHSVSRFKTAVRLSEQRPHYLPPLNICLQVNLEQESSKSGLAAADVLPLALSLSQLPRLLLRGLMIIPAPEKNFEKQRCVFHQLAELKQALNQSGLNLDTLSMGMTNDYVAAIAEGATIIRVGTAIFGQRKEKTL